MLRNLFLLAAACGVSLLLAEGALRLFPSLLTEEAALRMHWNEMGMARDQEGEVMVTADRELGFRYLPNRTGRLERGDFAFTFTTDEHGFRNPTPWPDKAEIVVIGDSMGFGYGVEDEQTWTSRVDSAFPESRLINLSMIGTGPQQYLELLERHGLGLDPDLVLYTLFPGNDVRDAKVFKEWRDTNREVGYRRWRMEGGEDEEDPGLIERVFNASYLVAVLRDVRRSLASPFAGETIEVENGSRLRLAPTTYVGSERLTQPGQPIFELTMETIETARARVEEAGGEFVVLLVPTKEEVYLQLRDRPHPDLVDPFANALDARGIPYLDLTQPLLEAAGHNGPLYFKVDGHPNARGYEVIAEAVVAYINERGEDIKAAKRD